MNRTDARVLVLKNVNAKASEMETSQILEELETLVEDSLQVYETPEPYFAVSDLADFANNHLVESTGSLADRLEEVAAFLVLAAQKERERERS